MPACHGLWGSQKKTSSPVLHLVLLMTAKSSPVTALRAEHRDLLPLSWCQHAQIGAALRPGVGKKGMGERLAFIGMEQHDDSDLRLGFAQGQAQHHARNGVGVLTAFQRVTRASVAQTLYAARPKVVTLK